MKRGKATGISATAVCWVLMAAGAAFPADPCDGLTEAQQKTARRVMSEFYVYDCCDLTLAECLDQKPKCRLVLRLKEEVCKRVSDEQTRQVIKKALYERKNSLEPGAEKHTIDTSALDAWLGDPQSKVALVGYLDSRCPYCAQITKELHREITGGRLKGKVAFHIRPFPLKIHPHGVEAAIAAAAAGRLGKFWPFLMAEYAHFDDYDGGKLAEWAGEVGLDGKEFDKLIADKATKNIVVESKKEGIANGVDETPTFFVNGKRYTADTSLEYMVDALEEEYDRVTGKKHE